MDTIKELAELAFASRLKRLSDRLSKDVTRLYKNIEVDFEARWFTVLYALNSKSPITVTSLAHTLGLTHTAIHQITSEMIQKRILISAKGEEDERQRLLSITPKGKEIAISLVPVWKEIHLATKKLIDNTGCDILTAIRNIEKQLDEQNMHERIWPRISDGPPGVIEILTYRPAYKKYFYSLNREWLEKYHSIEEEDKKIINDPNGKIIRKGGNIFFASLDKNIVGTAALVRHKNGIFELAKMAVTKKAQGLGIGRKLIQKVIEHAKNLGVNEIYLLTNTQLKDANHLYKQHGFRKTKKNVFANDRFIRRTYAMKLILGENL